MYLHSASCALVISTVQAAIKDELALFDAAGKLMALTCPARAEHACRRFAEARQGNDARLLHPFQYKDETACFVLFLDGAPSHAALAYVMTVLEMVLRQQSLSDQNDSDFGERLYLVYQLTMLGRSSGESLSVFTSRLKYDPRVPRCAIIFQIASSQQNEYREQARSVFIQAVQATPEYNREDIYEMLSFDQMIVFKALAEPWEGRAYRNAALGFAQAVIDNVISQSGLRITANVGSPYSDITHLRESFLEARFLLCNRAFLHSKQDVLLIEDFIFEYLSSLLPEESCRRKFKRFSPLADQPVLADTLISLSLNDVNVTDTARDMGLHRNTILNRYARLKELLGVDLHANDQDRLEARQYALYRKRKTLLHAGTNIQYGSIIHLGFCKFSELISRLSHDTIEVNLHVISNSGDNQHLVEILRGGSLDFAALDFNAIAQQTRNRVTVFQLPFLFDSTDEAFFVLDGAFGRGLASVLESSGLSLLGLWSMGWRMFTTNQRPIRRPGDMNALRLRVMHKDIVADYLTSLGATAIKMHYRDIQSALAQRLIDGQENPYGNIVGMKLYTNQNYVSELPIFFDVVNLLSTQQAMDRFTPSQREIILEAARQTTLWQHREMEAFNQKNKDELIRQGVAIVPFDPSTLEEWRASAQPFYDAFEPRDALAELLKAKEEYRASRAASGIV